MDTRHVLEARAVQHLNFVKALYPRGTVIASCRVSELDLHNLLSLIVLARTLCDLAPIVQQFLLQHNVSLHLIVKASDVDVRLNMKLSRLGTLEASLSVVYPAYLEKDTVCVIRCIPSRQVKKALMSKVAPDVDPEVLIDLFLTLYASIPDRIFVSVTSRESNSRLWKLLEELRVEAERFFKENAREVVEFIRQLLSYSMKTLKELCREVDCVKLASQDR